MFKHCNKKSAPGIDRIPISVYILGGERFLVWLTQLFEALRSSRHVISHWKQSEIQLLFKKGDPNLPENWRPISLLNALYKLFMALIQQRIFQHHRQLKRQRSNPLFSTNQRGFIPNMKGTTFNSALLRNLQNTSSIFYFLLHQLHYSYSLR